jgi:uncharacterized membrane protein YedE/YeeE
MSATFTPGSALLGGALIGLSASGLLALAGRVAGISGIVCGLLWPRRGETAWRAAFLAGLLVGGLLVREWAPGVLVPRAPTASAVALAVAGLMVGFGTQLGGGCTSGHGVCGLSRGSLRSAAAVLVFMTTGALAVFVSRHVLPRLG